jgi:hypothetical protein
MAIIVYQPRTAALGARQGAELKLPTASLWLAASGSIRTAKPFLKIRFAGLALEAHGFHTLRHVPRSNK